jgi:hypothetical protein
MGSDAFGSPRVRDKTSASRVGCAASASTLDVRGTATSAPRDLVASYDRDDARARQIEDMVITVTSEKDRWGDHVIYPARAEEPMEALASLFEDDLWWAADIVDRSPTRLVVRTSLLPHCADITTFEGSEEDMRALVSVASYCFADSERRAAARKAAEMLEEALGFPDGDASFATREEKALATEMRIRAACLSMAGIVGDADAFERGLRLPVSVLLVALRRADQEECSLDEALT